MWDGKRVDGCGDRQTDWRRRRRSQAVLVEQNPAAVTMTDTQFERGGEEGRLWNCRGREVRVGKWGNEGNHDCSGKRGQVHNCIFRASFGIYFILEAQKQKGQQLPPLPGNL